MKRNLTIDGLKLTLSFMIVGLHSGFLNGASPLFSYLMVNGLFRIAVPIFFLINGFYFLKVLDAGMHKEWIKRVIILYLIWMSFYAVFWVSFPELSFFYFVKFIKNILIGYEHLWYVAGLIGAAFTLLLLKNCSSIMLFSISMVMFLIGVIMQYSGNYDVFDYVFLNTLLDFYWAYRNFLFFSFPFFCIGYLIRKHKWHLKFSMPLLMGLSTLGVLLLLTESNVNFSSVDRERGFDIYLSLIFTCPVLFLLALKFYIPGNGKKISLYSSAIYFIHFFILELIRSYYHIEGTVLTFIVIILSTLLAVPIIKLSKKYSFII
jgi:hypothetical protein